MYISAKTDSRRALDAHRQPPFILPSSPTPLNKPWDQPHLGPSPPAEGRSPALRTSREPVTPSEWLVKGPTSPLSPAPRPGVQPSPQPPGRGEVPARLASPPQGPASPAGPRRRQRVIRGGEALRIPLPGVPSPTSEPLAPAPQGFPYWGSGAGAAPGGPHEKAGATPPYSPNVSSPSAVYLTAPPAYRAPPSWTYSTSPRGEMTAADCDLRHENKSPAVSRLSTELSDRRPRSTAPLDGRCRSAHS